MGRKYGRKGVGSGTQLFGKPNKSWYYDAFGVPRDAKKGTTAITLDESRLFARYRKGR